MFAVIKTGGKQYKAQEGEVLQIEKLDAEQGGNVTFNEVLLVEDGKKTLIGMPYVKDAVVEAVVLDNLKDDKVIVFKKKRRKQYRRMHGHRQELTRIRIEKIFVGKPPAKEKPVAKAEPEVKKAPVKTEKAEPAPRKPAAKPAAEKKAKAAVKKPAAKPAPKKAALKKAVKAEITPEKKAKPAAKKAAPAKKAGPAKPKAATKKPAAKPAAKAPKAKVKE